MFTSDYFDKIKHGHNNRKWQKFDSSVESPLLTIKFGSIGSNEHLASSSSTLKHEYQQKHAKEWRLKLPIKLRTSAIEKSDSDQ